jgi:hypothetical protein
VKVIMKNHVALLSVAIVIAMAGAQAGATTTVFTSKRSGEFTSDVGAPAPRALAANGLTTARHLFPVRDEKGLLLSCVAPELEINSETDVFKNCTLAPGRTLDELMHSFIKAIHQEEHQQAEHAAPDMGPEKKPEEKAAQR